jgi:hypothetical protein
LEAEQLDAKFDSSVFLMLAFQETSNDISKTGPSIEKPINRNEKEMLLFHLHIHMYL